MPLTPEKKQFLKKIGGGFKVLISCSQKGDEIVADPKCPAEEFIRDSIMYNGEFSQTKFDRVVDTASDEDLVNLLEYFDNADMNMKRVCYKSCLPTSENEYASLIKDGTLVTFDDFNTKSF